MFSFKIIARDKGARAGTLITPRGLIETPSFVPVATLASVRSLSGDDLVRLGSQVLIANTYHLHLQPGEDLIDRMGGLHRFMNWKGPIMTDSGGFQIFSLGAAKEHGVGKIVSIFSEDLDRGDHFPAHGKKPLVRVEEDGVEFISYLDGSVHRFTPENVIHRQRKLGSDILFVLDECTSPLHDRAYTRSAMARTHRWALRALEAFDRLPHNNQFLFGIVQGGAYRDFREESAAFFAEQGFDGYAVGGSLGKSRQDMYRVLQWTLPLLPDDRPRHLLGIGTIQDLFEVVGSGVDLFDCVVPSLMARTGTVLARQAPGFRAHIMNAGFRHDPKPIEEDCNCHTCLNHSRSYLRHLCLAKEPLGFRLIAVHNLHFMEMLMRQIRSAIREKRFESLAESWGLCRKSLP